MKKSLKYRESLPESRRIVVKIGSRVLVDKAGRPDMRCMRNLVGEVARMAGVGQQVVIVTSGAIGTGMQALGMRERPSRLPDLQMAAAVGQAKLMSRYDALFARQGIVTGQVLLTHDNFQHAVMLTNARRTMENMLRRGVIPIINENDVVSDEEIKADLALGDNDYLASLVVRLIRADLLILLTTVDGVLELDGGGRHRRIRYIERVTPKTLGLVTSGPSGISKGGMSSKLKAAHSVARAGCSAVIANGRQTAVLARILKGDDVGTLILACGV